MKLIRIRESPGGPMGNWQKLLHVSSDDKLVMNSNFESKHFFAYVGH